MNNEIARRIAMLADGFGKKTTATMLAMYSAALSDLDMKAVEKAISRAIQECKFFPSAAELRELSGVITMADRVMAAWNTFSKALVIHNHYSTVDFEDKAINATVRHLGGWIRASGLSGDELEKWYRKDFEKAYLRIAERGASAEQCLPLEGWHAKENKGRFIPKRLHKLCGIATKRVTSDLPALPWVRDLKKQISNKKPMLRLKGVPDDGHGEDSGDKESPPRLEVHDTDVGRAGLLDGPVPVRETRHDEGNQRGG